GDAVPPATDPTNPQPPSGSVKVHSASFGVTYDTIEHLTVLATPVADAGGPYAAAEGGGLTLNAGATRIPSGQQGGSYEGGVGDTFGGGTGTSPTLTWAQLAALGVRDSGTYQVALRVTTRATAGGQTRTFSDTAVTTLTVSDTPPTLAVAGPAAVEAGSLYTLNLSAT